MMPISQLSKVNCLRPCKFQDKKNSHRGMPDFSSHKSKVKHVSSPWPSNSTPRNLHKRNGCISQQNKVLGDFHSSFTHNRNKTKTWQQPKYPSTKEWINKLGNSYKWSIYYWAEKKKKLLNHITTQRLHWGKKPDTKCWFHLYRSYQSEAKLYDGKRCQKRGSLVGGVVTVKKVARKKNLLEWWKVLFFDPGGNHTMHTFM